MATSVQFPLGFGQLQCKKGKALVIQSDESERNAQRKLQVMDMDPPSFDLLTDMP